MNDKFYALVSDYKEDGDPEIYFINQDQLNMLKELDGMDIIRLINYGAVSSVKNMA